ncbi:MAG: hypothetical protein ACK4FG_01090 [Brevundimonas sp.]
MPEGLPSPPKRPIFQRVDKSSHLVGEGYLLEDWTRTGVFGCHSNLVDFARSNAERADLSHPFTLLADSGDDRREVSRPEDVMKLDGKRILVTVADGFVGSHLAERLVARGLSVRAFCLYNSLNSWRTWWR